MVFVLCRFVIIRIQNTQMAKMENQVGTEEKLIIKNFGPIKNVEIDLKKIILFIGPQGSGKSTIAKLIAIFRDHNYILESFIFDAVDYSKDYSFFENYNLQNYFIEDNVNENLSTFLQYQSTNYTVTYSKGEFKLLRGSFYDAVLRKEKETIENLRKDERLKEIFNLERVKPGFSELFSEIAVSVKYIPTERFLTSLISDSLSSLIFRDIYLPPFIHKFNSDFQNARNSIKELNIKYLNIRYKYEKSVDKLFFNKKKFLKLSESASGQQAIIPLLLVLNYFEKNNLNNSFIIEEPELNLFPETQKELIKEIASYMWYANNSMAIATHSPYVLSSFSLLLFAFQVAQKNHEQVNKLIPERCWINPEKFSAYFIADGECKSIFNKETGLIAENELDKTSLNIGDEFDRLMDIYSEMKNIEPK